MKTFLRKSRIFAIVFVIANLFFSSAVFGQATVTLDQADLDYAPGETVYITGSGWEPGETVTLEVSNLTNPDVDCGAVDPEPHVLWTTVADGAGNFTASWYVNNCELGADLMLGAFGTISGFTYEIFFTDADRHDIYFATTGLPSSTSITVAWSGTSDNDAAFSGSTTFNSPGPTGSSQKVSTRANTLFNFSFPTISGYALSSTSQTSPFTTGEKNGSTTVTGTYIPNPAGIYASYAIMNFGGSDVYYDLSAATANTDFNGVNFGTYNSSQSLYLDGAQNKTFKCASPSDVLNGKLYYRIYLTSGAAGAFSSAVNLPFLSNDGGSGCNIAQTWQKADAGVNLLNGLCDGNYTIEVYTTADTNLGTVSANNSGANYKATFTVKNDDRSGIYQSAIILKSNGGGDTYYDLQGATPNNDFTGSIGSFCQTGSLVIAGAENKVFKCSPNDITGNSLRYRVYSGSPAGSFQTVGLSHASDDGASVCGGLNQTWRSVSNATNILTGLTPGTYTLEVYTEAAYTSNGICAGTHYSNNGGANYKATFTVLAAPIITTTYSNISVNNDAGQCGAVVSYAAATATGTPDPTIAYSTTSGSLFPVGITTVTVTATNSCGVDTKTFTVTVVDNQIPVISGVGVESTIDCPALPSFSSPTVSDNCLGATLAFVDLTTPGFCAGNYSVKRTWTATDAVGLTATASQTITVVDTTVPTWTVEPSDMLTVECNPSGNAAVFTTWLGSFSGSDTCGTATVTNDSTGLSDLCGGTGTETVTFILTDLCGNFITEDATFTIIDTQNPTASNPAPQTVQCFSDIAAPNVAVVTDEADNCDGTPTVAFVSDDITSATCDGASVTVLRTYSVTDCSGNSINVVQTINVDDVTNPTVLTQPYTVYLNSSGAGSITVANINNGSSDNCEGVLTYELSKTQFSCSDVPNVNVTLTVTDCSGNFASQTAVVTVVDNTKPVITCTTDKAVNPNYVGCVYKHTGTGWNASASDNCSVSSIKYTLSGDTTSATDAFTTLNNVVFNVGTTTVTAYAYDASNNKSIDCTFNVTVTKTLSATSTNSNNVLYYGYPGDQTSTFSVTPLGGTGPYTVSITMNRAKKCNQINDAGDESWTADSGSTTTGNGCPGFPSMVGSTPISVKVISAGIFSVTVSLMADATITATVTDSNGCVVTTSTAIHAEDVRCFAGNSGNAKVTICHRTGSVKNPCIAICVDQSAVQEHLNHGDYVGVCTKTCEAPINTKLAEVEETAVFKVTAYPNPSQTQFTLLVEGDKNEKVEVLVYDMLARMVKRIENTDGQPIQFGEELPSGEYLTIVKQGENMKAVNLIKQ